MISLTRLTPPEGRKRMQRYTLFGNHQNFYAIIFKNKATFSRLLTNIKGNPYKRCHFWTKSLGTTSSKCWYAQSINDEIVGIRDLPVSVSEFLLSGVPAAPCAVEDIEAAGPGHYHQRQLPRKSRQLPLFSYSCYAKTLFYIKPQHACRYISVFRRCLISLFYIKPQLPPRF